MKKHSKTVLKFSCTDIGSLPEGFSSTEKESFSLKQIQALSKRINGNISSLVMSGMGLTDEAFKIICNALETQLNNSANDISLDFSNNNLTDESVAALTSFSFHIKALNLRNNNFGDGALGFKGSILSGKIDTVNLNNNYIEDTSSIKDFRDFSGFIQCLNQQPLEVVGDVPENNES